MCGSVSRFFVRHCRTGMRSGLPARHQLDSRTPALAFFQPGERSVSTGRMQSRRYPGAIPAAGSLAIFLSLLPAHPIALYVACRRYNCSRFVDRCRNTKGNALQENTRQDNAKHWGLLATLLWGALIAAVYVVVGTLVAGIYVGATHGALSSEALSEALANTQFDGMAISLSAFVTTAVCGSLIVIVVKLKRGADLSEYLGLSVPSWRETGKWLLLFAALLACLDLLTYALGKPIVPEFMWRVYGSTESRWILWIALIVAAPLIEELFFRGFLIKGISASPIGPVGAVILTSAVWAMIHMQYDLYGITTIFVMGLVLGAARIMSGSTILTIFLHAFANFVATVETVIYLTYFNPAG